MTQRVAFITGCSEPSSLGASFALDLLSRGWKVIASARKLETMQSLEVAGCEVVEMDVSSDSSVQEAATAIQKLSKGRLDLVINNAGVAALGPLMDMDVEKMKEMYDINVFGPVRVVQALLRLLVDTATTAGDKRGSSPVIINLPSNARHFPVWQGSYGSSKAAFTSISETMRLELEPLGIKVLTVQLALVKTAMSTNQKPFPLLRQHEDRSGFYDWEDSIQPATRKMSDEMTGKAPLAKDVAKYVLDIALSDRVPRSISTGQGAWTIWMLGFLPIWILDRLFKKVFRLDLVSRPQAGNL